MASRYEELRQKNLEDNKRVLQQLGLLNPFKPLPRVVHRVPLRKRKRETLEEVPCKAAKLESELNASRGSLFSPGQKRRSSRIQGLVAESPKEASEKAQKELEEDEEENRTPRIQPNRPKFYGQVPGVEVGTWWETRLACSAAGIHRPTVAGIHGGEEGCYSLALSGGYEDDIDMGECFTYTGEGGRDLKGTKANPKNLRTAAQSKDQSLTRGNLALSVSVETEKPVRVIRGYKLQSAFAPEEGYRYDGLYKVEKFWYTIGLAGFGVYKFALRRLDDQTPPPWDIMTSSQEDDTENNSEKSTEQPHPVKEETSSQEDDTENNSEKSTEQPHPVKDENLSEEDDSGEKESEDGKIEQSKPKTGQTEVDTEDNSEKPTETPKPVKEENLSDEDDSGEKESETDGTTEQSKAVTGQTNPSKEIDSVDIKEKPGDMTELPKPVIDGKDSTQEETSVKAEDGKVNATDELEPATC